MVESTRARNWIREGKVASRVCTMVTVNHGCSRRRRCSYERKLFPVLCAEGSDISCIGILIVRTVLYPGLETSATFLRTKPGKLIRFLPAIQEDPHDLASKSD
jgi:hypothetical protein